MFRKSSLVPLVLLEPWVRRIRESYVYLPRQLPIIGTTVDKHNTEIKMTCRFDMVGFTIQILLVMREIMVHTTLCEVYLMTKSFLIFIEIFLFWNKQ